MPVAENGSISRNGYSLIEEIHLVKKTFYFNWMLRSASLFGPSF